MLTFAQLFAQCLLPGESPESAAGRVGISDRTARLYFNGSSLPARPKYQALARSMGVPPEQLEEVVSADRERLQGAHTEGSTTDGVA